MPNRANTTPTQVRRSLGIASSMPSRAWLTSSTGVARTSLVRCGRRSMSKARRRRCTASSMQRMGTVNVRPQQYSTDSCTKTPTFSVEGSNRQGISRSMLRTAWPNVVCDRAVHMTRARGNHLSFLRAKHNGGVLRTTCRRRHGVSP